MGSHTSLKDPKLRRESNSNIDGGGGRTGPATSIGGGRKISATNPMFDCATQ